MNLSVQSLMRSIYFLMDEESYRSKIAVVKGRASSSTTCFGEVVNMLNHRVANYGGVL